MEQKDLTIILVHGAWGDGSHWQYIIPSLVKEGYKVRSVQNPLTSLQNDIDKTKDLIDAQEGKVLLVGHSYGGAVISGAGNHDKVVGLVYIAAFAPDAGDSLGSLLGRRESPGGASIYPDNKGFLWIKYDEFKSAFCQDLDDEKALVMALSQKPIHGQCFGDAAGEPAWKTKPSWYQISSNDRMIPAETEKEMAERMQPKKIITLEAGHASLASHPEEVTQLILEAASSL
ncbi:hydrolase [Chryseobacterium contaminans]|uniref:Hydrolase n=1 Tax=Chryseobacterium contaminans TaxID=1423959 RepID=A0A1M7FUW2_9FLAO|nr:alpha/beta hydrolase [Chryseobacterium contaminans]OCA79395.1 hydrolase [Chryseobacterium contaminans]SHM07874.1 Pimeloyl-ACP methyl ester carboxylesterase [Chryseobacterium contaminans]